MDISKIKNHRTIRIILLLITVSLIVLMFPRGESIESDVAVHSIWIKNDLIASVTFEILKDPQEIKKERMTGSVSTVYARTIEETGVTTMDVIKGVTPFVIIILFSLVLLVIFPQIVLWLPEHMIQPWT